MSISKYLLCFAPLAAFHVQAAPMTEINPLEVPALEAVRSASMQRLVEQRYGYQDLFKRAYAQYPALPEGTLESIAVAQTGWRNVQPAKEAMEHRHMPAAYGVMGLYQGEGFDDQVGAAAKLIGLSRERVTTDPAANILAAAALLDRAFRQAATASGGKSFNDEAVMANALQRYAGFGKEAGNIQSYARQSFAYQVLTAVSKGVKGDGIRVPAQAINIDKAFPAAQLKLLQAPVLTLRYDSDSVDMDDGTTAQPPVDAGKSAGTAQAKAMDFGEAIWNPASGNNYSTAWNSTSAVILHTMEGSYAGAISWFKNPSAQVSAHYLIRKSDGQITQMVREHHQAWHAAYHNSYTIGIEHDGYASDPGNWSANMVNASARLTSSICARQGVNCASAWQGPGYNYWHVVPDSVRVKGHGMLTSNQNRYDPGQYFPWAHYYSLINGGAPPPPAQADVRYWVDTYANAPGYGSPTSTSQTGTLYQGTNYVYCKSWGREVRSGGSFNHWWLKTDLDVGPGGQWVSAYYLSRWGNDEARDNDGYDLPRCEVLPYGKIGEKYYAMGGIRSVLGVPKLAEMAAQLGGRFQEFNNGIILWHADTGAFAIRGAFLQHFWATNAETRWGFALMDEMDASVSPSSGQRGRYQYFENGLFLWTPATGAHAVYGAILTHFENTGRESQYGYPLAEEEAWGSNGRKQRFERGTFYWNPQQGVSVQ
ncbi:MAG: N-acetylmuramoyl-L-alanine amidase [Xanthomonadales bacterium]|nr:N-acetylmuramoyl-L-alanine amidase [Xanthomonadales bacterium]